LYLCGLKLKNREISVASQSAKSPKKTKTSRLPSDDAQAARRPRILVTNDDGIDAEGLEVLAKAMSKIGEVTVVAPNAPQSGMSHAMTLGKPLRIKKAYKHKKFFGYAISGTPVDCVKAALAQILPEKPDLVVSGINHGSNTAINILYSGTVAAAREAAIAKIPAIAFSLTTYGNPDFRYAAKFAKQLALKVLKHGLPAETLLTVNIPNLPEEKIKGVAITQQGKSKWHETMIERADAYGEPYYWLRGELVLQDDSLEDDEFAIRNDYVSVTPISFDQTNYAFLETVRTWNLKK
jgi:5'-nucleotidase